MNGLEMAWDDTLPLLPLKKSIAFDKGHLVEGLANGLPKRPCPAALRLALPVGLPAPVCVASTMAVLVAAPPLVAAAPPLLGGCPTLNVAPSLLGGGTTLAGGDTTPAGWRHHPWWWRHHPCVVARVTVPTM